MLPFLNIPIALPGDADKGNDDKQVTCKINPSKIDAYHEGYAWGTFIYLSTGQAFCCTLTVDQFEAQLQAYWQQVLKTEPKIKTLN